MHEARGATFAAQVEDSPASADGAFALFSWPKVCACGASYERLDWQRLPAIGVMRVVHDSCLDLRNCSCGSTLAAPEDDVFKPTLLERHCDAVRIARFLREQARAITRRSADARYRLRKRIEEMRRARYLAI